MPTSALTGAPYPAPSSADNVSADMLALVTHYDTRVLLSFADTAERDSAIPDPVAPLLAWCASPGTLYLYDGTAWRIIYEAAPTWRDITLVSGFTIQTADPSYLIEAGRKVYLAGNIRPTATGGKISNGQHIATLPPEAYPPRTPDVPAATQYVIGNAPGRLSIQPSGDILYQGPDVAWVSLDNVSYWLHWRTT